MNFNLGFELEARVELIKIREHYRQIDPELAADFDAEFREGDDRRFSSFPEAFSRLLVTASDAPECLAFHT
ncbi:MAG: hypothetical protein HC933_08265 [Pleurocapsa sp. SU_196_0]|nr:hypothetical protein [Pleurocapsa sp. SU_196_0]